MPLPPTLTDGLVTLRAHTAQDAQGVLEQCQDPASQRWTRVPVPYSLADAHQYVGQTVPVGWLSDTEWSFAVEAEGRFAGTVSLRNEGERRAEIAYGAHPWARGTGHLERALRLLLAWGFADQGLVTVAWWAHRGNWASRKLAWRVGFRVEGDVRRWLTHGDQLVDAWVGTLLAEDPQEPSTPWLVPPVLDLGEGLHLRPFADTDVPRIVEACREERIQRWLGQIPSPYTEADAWDYLDKVTERHATNGGLTWAVADAEETLVATVGIFDHTPGVVCEVGYWTHPDARGRGVMTRAFPEVVRYAFENFGVARVKALAAVGNVASRHVIEQGGLLQSGIERLGASVRAGRADLALYDVLASEWSPDRPSESASSRRWTEADQSSTPTPSTESPAPTRAGER